MIALRSFLSKLNRLRSNPGAVGPYLRYRLAQLRWHLLNGHVVACLLVPLDTIGLIDGRQAYMEYLSTVRNRETVTVTLHGSRVELSPASGDIDQSLLWKGDTREFLSTREYERVLTVLDSRPDDVLILDIGSNIGYFALLAARTTPASDIVAFEANSQNFERLSRNLTRNTAAVEPINKAVGEQAGSNELVVNDKSTLHQVADATDHDQADETEPVEIVALDEYLATRPEADTYVVRMDIEGYEYKALLGMSELLASEHSIFLFVELHLNRLGSEAYNGLLDLLVENGFDIHFVCRHAGIRAMDIDSLEELRHVDAIVHLQATKNLSL